MARVNTEIVVGVFVLLGLLALGYLAIRLGQMDVLGRPAYTVHARFATVGGLRTGSPVEIAGVQVGRVDRINLEGFQARIGLRLNNDFQLPDDSIVSIRTRGLIGEQFVRISPGGSDQMIPSGGEIIETEPPVDVMDLIAQYAFGKI